MADRIECLISNEDATALEAAWRVRLRDAAAALLAPIPDGFIEERAAAVRVVRAQIAERHGIDLSTAERIDNRRFSALPQTDG